MFIPVPRDTDPLNQFLKWFEEAIQAGIKDPDAMTLATASSAGAPSARIVLYKGIFSGGLRFFTNYQSRKAKELQKNPLAALVFYWPALARQVRVEGRVKKLPGPQSDDYWNTRPRESRINSLVSPQSTAIPNMEILIQKIRVLNEKFDHTEIPRPQHWGGYYLVPNYFEFWTAGEFRLHDRFSYVKKGKKWVIAQLAP